MSHISNKKIKVPYQRSKKAELLNQQSGTSISVLILRVKRQSEQWKSNHAQKTCFQKQIGGKLFCKYRKGLQVHKIQLQSTLNNPHCPKFLNINRVKIILDKLK